MSKSREEALADQAARVADGQALDWEREREASPESADALAGLARVARIAQAWRDLGVQPDDGEAAGPAALFQWGGLEVIEKLGEGAFGEVYRAWDVSLEREVALKLRRGSGDEATARRELAEARRLARVRHPNVLTVHGVDVHDGRAGLWTDLVRGRTLEQLLAERGKLGAEEATLVGLDLCRALAAVHAAGLAHGDLKASNVMREDGGRVVLMDFGSVRELDDSGAFTAYRTGTPLATAPEVLGGASASVAADLYSLGVLLYRLVSAQYPVAADSLEQLRARLERGERTPLRVARPDLPSAFVTAIERAIEPDPAKRHADAGAFERALAATLSGATAGEAPAAPREKRSAMALAVPVAAVLLVALAAAWWWASRVQPSRVPAPSDIAVVAPPEGATSAPGAGDGGAQPQERAPQPSAAPPVVDATLWRARDGARAALEDGSSVAPGDHLYLDVGGREALFVYVLDEDEHGETYTLFPVGGTDLGNPLPAGTSHRLPGTRGGEAFDWVVTSQGGREHVLIVASRRRIAALEKLVAASASADPARAVAYASVDANTYATLRGIGGMAKAPESAARESRLEALGRSLSASADGAFWVRHLSLENR